VAVNKVEINGVVKLDLTQDTVTAAKLAQGETAHDASGEIITGTMTAPQLQIAVTTSAGATVTATKGSKTVSGTADASGNCTLTVDETGEWSVVSAQDGLTGSATIVVGTNEAQIVLVDSTFGNNTWQQIIDACKAKSIPSSWKLGDKKTITMTSGTSYQVRIIGKNHDEYSDGSGKAPLTFQLAECLKTARAMTTGFWKDCTIRTSVLPSTKNILPAEVAAGLRLVNKKCANRSGTLFTVQDDLFLLSERELGGYSLTDEGTAYDLFKGLGGSASPKRVLQRDGQNSLYWTRTVTGKASEGYWRYVDEEGMLDQYSYGGKLGVSFAFCF
jgi:hypothetical protein